MAQALGAVLFDLDGTLLDTAPDMVAALNALRIERHLSALPFQTVRPVVSHGSARLVKLGFPDADAQEFAVLQGRYLEIYRAGLALQTRLFAGMDSVLTALEARGVALGIVTNKPAWLTVPLLEALALRRRFASVVSGDTLSERKPHPLPLLHAAQEAGVAPETCIYVGDAERDIQAAHAAGMAAVVAVYGYLENDEDWRSWGGDGFVERPLDLIDWLARSRPA